MKNLLILLLFAVVSCKTANLPDITVSGIAENRKAGPVIVTDDNDVYYIEGIESLDLSNSWHFEDVGWRISITGKLEVVDIAKNTSVAQVQSTTGIKKTIKNAQFTSGINEVNCNNITAIINTPEFEKHFQISKRFGDSLTVYIGDYGDLDASVLCNAVTTASGKVISFAKADFEVKIDETSRSVTNPRIVVWKEKGKYRFFETETNLNFDASVKKGKVKVLGRGVF